MKCLILSLFMSLNAMATESSTFKILPGKLHKGGSLVATQNQTDHADEMVIDMSYQITKKDFVPVPSQYLKGTYQQKLPALFQDERGYLDLERAKSMRIQDANVMHLGRTTLGQFHDAHLIKILPDNKKSEILITYHPSIEGLGWDNLKLTLHTDLPLLNDYRLEGQLK